MPFYILRPFFRSLTTLCCLLAGNIAIAAPGQKVSVEQSSVYSGEVYSICKDARGEIWMATKDGLCIFDGFELTPVSPLRQIKPRHISYDADNDQLLVYDRSNLYCIRARTHQILYQKSFGKDTISAISQIADRYYVATTGGMLSLFYKSGKPQKQVKTPIRISAITAVPGRGVFLTDGAGFYRYSESDRKIISIATGKRDIAASAIWHSGDTLLLSTWHRGLHLYDARSLQKITPPMLLKLDSVNKGPSVALLDDSILYAAFASYNFYIIDLKKGTHQNLSTTNRLFYGKRFNCLFKDGNTLWLGTDNGLIKITIQQRLFRQLLSGAEPPVSTRSFLSRDDDLYVASYSGIFRCNLRRNQTENLNAGFTGNFKFVTPYAMAAVGRYLYLFLESKLLFRYDLVDKTVSNSFYNTTGGLEMSSAFCVAQDRSGIFWIGTQRGIVSFDPATNTLYSRPDSRYQVNRSTVKSLFYDSTTHSLLAASSSGLYRIDLIRGREQHAVSAAYPAINKADLLFVSKEKDGRIWAGTNGDGAYLLDENLAVVRHLHKDDGLSDNRVYAIIVKDNRAWMTTYNGLSSYNMGTNRFYNYYEEDGLANNQFNHNSCLDADGLLYLGGIDGISICQPKLLDRSQEPFRIYLSAVRKWQLNGDEVVESVAEANRFEKLPSDISMGIQLGVSAPSHTDETIFLYRISDIDTQWKRIKTSNLLRLDGLSYGSYKVEVKAIDYRGQLSQNVLRISVIITAPFYFRWWFYLLLATLVATIAVLIFRRKLAELNRYQQLRVQIASDLHDEVGSILTSISMYSDNLRSTQQSGRDGQDKVDKIAGLSRRAILSMRDILWAIDARNDFSIDLAEHIRSHAEDLLLPKNINIHFTFDGDTVQRSLKGSTRQHLYFITKEAVNNIARHSDAANVYIKFAVHRQHFELEIANDGLRQESAFRNGLGLKNMKERALKMDASFDWEISDERFFIRVKR